MLNECNICFLCVSIKSSLKDDDSGDHDQDQGSPKDGEKEKIEDEDKEQNISKKKVSQQYLTVTDSYVFVTSDGQFNSLSSFFVDGGTRGRRAPSSIQLHLLVLQTHPGETSQHPELRAEHQTDWQLRLGLLLFQDSLLLSQKIDQIYVYKLILRDSPTVSNVNLFFPFPRWSSSGVSIVT